MKPLPECPLCGAKCLKTPTGYSFRGGCQFYSVGCQRDTPDLCIYQGIPLPLHRILCALIAKLRAVGKVQDERKVQRALTRHDQGRAQLLHPERLMRGTGCGFALPYKEGDPIEEVYAKALEHDAHCPKNPHVLRAEKAEADNARLKGEVESAQKEIMAAAVELGEVRPELARLKGELEKARGALEEADRRFANSGHLPMAEWLALKPAAEGEKP